MERTVIRGNEFYEIDLECEKNKKSGSQHSETTERESKTSKAQISYSPGAFK